MLDSYAGVLARWPVPLETLTLQTTLGETFALACGPPGAPPLVLLHGAGSNSGVWAGEIARFAVIVEGGAHALTNGFDGVHAFLATQIAASSAGGLSQQPASPGPRTPCA